MLVYANDILVRGGDDTVVATLITKLHQVFALKDLGEVSYFLGIYVTPTEHGLHLSQTKYISDLLCKCQM